MLGKSLVVASSLLVLAAAPVPAAAQSAPSPGATPVTCSGTQSPPAPARGIVSRTNGGVVRDPGEIHVLRVAPWAIRENTEFRMQLIRSDSLIVEITPSPTRFRRPAVLAIAYGRLGCTPLSAESEVELWQVGAGGEVLDVVPAWYDAERGVLFVEGINHLTRYVIATH